MAIFDVEVFSLIFSLLMVHADGDAKGVHALQWLCTKG